MILQNLKNFDTFYRIKVSLHHHDRRKVNVYHKPRLKKLQAEKKTLFVLMLMF